MIYQNEIKNKLKLTTSNLFLQDMNWSIDHEELRKKLNIMRLIDPQFEQRDGYDVGDAIGGCV